MSDDWKARATEYRANWMAEEGRRTVAELKLSQLQTQLDTAERYFRDMAQLPEGERLAALNELLKLIRQDLQGSSRS